MWDRQKRMAKTKTKCGRKQLSFCDRGQKAICANDEKGKEKKSGDDERCSGVWGGVLVCIFGWCSVLLRIFYASLFLFCFCGDTPPLLHISLYTTNLFSSSPLFFPLPLLPHVGYVCVCVCVFFFPRGDGAL